MKTGLILVGAGPGDPELLTIKGLKAIKRADVMLYDALVSTQLLEYARPDCKKIYVGKRAGTHSMSQRAINSLIMKYAKDQLVVRLKGGDPFVFGRGYEEWKIAEKYSIKVQVVPGISSAIAGPSAAGIPLTSRGVCRSFWVVTATNASYELSMDVKLAARSSATLIILMGTKKLKEVASLIAMARNAFEPMAVIQNATCQDERVVFGTATTIVDNFGDGSHYAPGIIVAGQVVAKSKMDQTFVKLLKERVLAA